jgi:MSHA biogenesis protein MshO
MAATLQANSLVFAITPPSLKRGAVVSFQFVLESPNSDETLTVQQEVQIRNVP